MIRKGDFVKFRKLIYERDTSCTRKKFKAVGHEIVEGIVEAVPDEAKKFVRQFFHVRTDSGDIIKIIGHNLYRRLIEHRRKYEGDNPRGINGNVVLQKIEAVVKLGRHINTVSMRRLAAGEFELRLLADDWITDNAEIAGQSGMLNRYAVERYPDMVYTILCDDDTAEIWMEQAAQIGGAVDIEKIKTTDAMRLTTKPAKWLADKQFA